jgi:hypothetical protein
MALRPDDVLGWLSAEEARPAPALEPFPIDDSPHESLLDSSGMDIRALGLGAVSLSLGAGGGGAKLNPNQAPQGQHANVELAAKLTAAKNVDSQLAALAQQINSALVSNQALLLATPQTAGLVSVAQNALSDLQSAANTLEASFWSGTNFNTFQGSTDAWNQMDAATQAATQKLQAYSQLATQLAGGVAQAQAAQQNAQAQQAAQAQAQQQAQVAVSSAIATANNQAALGDYPSALATLADPSVSSAASTSGMTTVLSNAQASIRAQKAQADKAASDAAAQAAAAQSAQQAAAQQAAAQAQADRAAQQSQIELQKFQAQLAADAAQRAADAAAADRQFQQQMAQQQADAQQSSERLQLLLTAAPLLGRDVVAAAVAQELGIDPASAGNVADRAGAGQALGPGGAGGVALSDFTPETSF